jgi:hypothetical protein
LLLLPDFFQTMNRQPTDDGATRVSIGMPSSIVRETVQSRSCDIFTARGST